MFTFSIHAGQEADPYMIISIRESTKVRGKKVSVEDGPDLLEKIMKFVITDKDGEENLKIGERNIDSAISTCKVIIIFISLFSFDICHAYMHSKIQIIQFGTKHFYYI